MLSFRIVMYKKVKKEYKCYSTYYRQFENKNQAEDFAKTFDCDRYIIKQIPVAVFLYYTQPTPSPLTHY